MITKDKRKSQEMTIVLGDMFVNTAKMKKGEIFSIFELEQKGTKMDPMVHGSWSSRSHNVACYGVSGMASPRSEG